MLRAKNSYPTSTRTNCFSFNAKTMYTLYCKKLQRLKEYDIVVKEKNKSEWMDAFVKIRYMKTFLFFTTHGIHVCIIITTFAAFGFPFGAALLIPLRFLVQFWRSGTVKRRRRA